MISKPKNEPDKRYIVLPFGVVYKAWQFNIDRLIGCFLVFIYTQIYPCYVGGWSGHACLREPWDECRRVFTTFDRICFIDNGSTWMDVRKIAASILSQVWQALSTTQPLKWPAEHQKWPSTRVRRFLNFSTKGCPPLRYVGPVGDAHCRINQDDSSQAGSHPTWLEHPLKSTGSGWFSRLDRKNFPFLSIFLKKSEFLPGVFWEISISHPGPFLTPGIHGNPHPPWPCRADQEEVFRLCDATVLEELAKFARAEATEVPRWVNSHGDGRFFYMGMGQYL